MKEPEFLKKLKANEKIVLIVAIIVYLVTMFVQVQVSRGDHISGANGLISQLQVLLSVTLVVLARKNGAKATTVLNIINCLSTLVMGVFVGHNMGALPGAIAPLITILICQIIHSFAVRAERSNDELQQANSDLIQTNKSIRAHDKELSNIIYHDELTGLRNEAYLLKKMKEMIENRSASRFTVILGNVDNFTRFNERFGFSMGDIVLSTFAYRLRNFSEKADFIARYHGDTFAIVLKDKRSRDAIIRYVETINEEICAPIAVNGTQQTFSMSFGVASFPNDGRSCEALLETAMEAAARAHAKGAGQIAFAGDAEE